MEKRQVTFAIQLDWKPVLQQNTSRSRTYQQPCTFLHIPLPKWLKSWIHPTLLNYRLIYSWWKWHFRWIYECVLSKRCAEMTYPLSLSYNSKRSPTFWEQNNLSRTWRVEESWCSEHTMDLDMATVSRGISVGQLRQTMFWTISNRQKQCYNFKQTNTILNCWTFTNGNVIPRILNIDTCHSNIA